MDIRLRTHTDNATFKLLDCRALDEERFECFLVVRSGPFQAHTSFCFDRASLRALVARLQEGNRPLAGECRLGHPGGRQFIALRGNGRGQVAVSGLLAPDGSQCLRFELPVAAASLAQLVADLEELADDYSFRLCPGDGFGFAQGHPSPGLPKPSQCHGTGGGCECLSGSSAAAMLAASPG